MRLVAAVAATLVVVPAAAQEIQVQGPLASSPGVPLRFGPRDTARPVADWSMGVFDPLRIALSKDVELSTHPLLFLVLSPNLELKLAHSRTSSWHFASTLGLSVPTVAMRLTKGFLFPSWADDGGRIGFVAVPSVGLLATHEKRADAITFGLETSIGVPLGPSDARPLDTYAPLELLLAPATGGLRVHAHVTLDSAITGWLRARIGLDAYYLGHRVPEPPKSPMIYAAHGGIDLRVSGRARLSLGAIAYDYDDHRTEVRKDDGKWRRVGVRSIDVFPTLDFIYVR